jgi:hypothetical protein
MPRSDERDLPTVSAVQGVGVDGDELTLHWEDIEDCRRKLAVPLRQAEKLLAYLQIAIEGTRDRPELRP